MLLCPVALAGCATAQKSESQEIRETLSTLKTLVERHTHGESVVLIGPKKEFRIVGVAVKETERLPCESLELSQCGTAVQAVFKRLSALVNRNTRGESIAVIVSRRNVRAPRR